MTAMKGETMEAKHTKGPWTADIRTGMFAIYQGKNIADVLPKRLLAK